MRRGSLPLVAVLVAAGMAGCIGPDDATAQEMRDEAIRVAARTVPRTDWMGIAAVESPDLHAVQAALAEDDEDAKRFLEAFDFRVDDGVLGDGRTGSWFSFHLAQDDRGPSFTAVVVQVFADGRAARTLVDRTDFGGSVEEHPANGAAQNGRLDPLGVTGLHGPPQVFRTHADAAARDDTCITDPAWRIDSTEAATIAAAVPEFAAHVQAFPAAAYAYSYLPATPDEPCEGNTWIVEHLDIGRILDGKAPTGVAVWIDASDGTVQDVQTIDDLLLQRIGDERLVASGPPVPTLGAGEPTTAHMALPVADDTVRLEIAAYREQSGGLFGFLAQAELWIEDPSGQRVADWDGEAVTFGQDDPTPGEWSLHYSFASRLPSEQHAINVDAFVVRPA